MRKHCLDQDNDVPVRGFGASFLIIENEKLGRSLCESNRHNSLSGQISDVHERVVERREDVCDTEGELALHDLRMQRVNSFYTTFQGGNEHEEIRTSASQSLGSRFTLFGCKRACVHDLFSQVLTLQTAHNRCLRCTTKPTPK
jgi:hypothetical protein